MLLLKSLLTQKETTKEDKTRLCVKQHQNFNTQSENRRIVLQHSHSHTKKLCKLLQQKFRFQILSEASIISLYKDVRTKMLEKKTSMESGIYNQKL